MQAMKNHFCQKVPLLLRLLGTSYTFPWRRDSQCQNSAYNLARNTPNASYIFSPICLPKPKSFEFLRKSSVWVSVVRGSRLSLLMRDVTKKFQARSGFAQKWGKIILEKHFYYLSALTYFFIGYF